MWLTGLLYLVDTSVSCLEPEESFFFSLFRHAQNLFELFFQEPNSRCDVAWVHKKSYMNLSWFCVSHHCDFSLTFLFSSCFFFCLGSTKFRLAKLCSGEGCVGHMNPEGNTWFFHLSHCALIISSKQMCIKSKLVILLCVVPVLPFAINN